MTFSETVMRIFAGFSREELGIHSDVEVEEYDENDEDDETVKLIHNELAAQVVNQEWTRTLTSTNVPPFAVENSGPTNTLNENQTELNFFELLYTDEVYEILVREINLYARHKVTVMPDLKWRDVEKDEMNAYLGIRVYMSIVKLPETQMHWAKDFLFSSLGIAAIIAKGSDRQNITVFLCEQPKYHATDKNLWTNYLVRPVLYVILRQIKVNYVSDEDLSVAPHLLFFIRLISH